ncbi:YcbK family protein [Tepidibacter hydrothermalis]|uniref:D-Ala-D-Ala carboxypeptidase family metallohydrolase n=1 Tax=Tepidibacter hydrothermalis TaxID=3036126 RepID=A0ABY8EGF1_9FIRM|nr:D-Ala-D-Ala carboxypeptidase family metallohydrolase [Tepidibacter hydrothermalis]WFD12023.1 D-Ala-D-Ala carboxypeptidase family metallohydrolase [Tepidibacter hydrothermalis]
MIYKGQSKYKDKPITEHFRVGEIVCHDGSSEYIINSKALEGLEKLREIIKKPIIINSGYRTVSYNKRCGGSPKSQHLVGNAIDFHVKGMSTEDIYHIMKTHNMIGKEFKGIGLYNTFVHVDVRPNPNRRGYSFWDMRK